MEGGGGSLSHPNLFYNQRAVYKPAATEDEMFTSTTSCVESHLNTWSWWTNDFLKKPDVRSLEWIWSVLSLSWVKRARNTHIFYFLFSQVQMSFLWPWRDIRGLDVLFPVLTIEVLFRYVFHSARIQTIWSHTVSIWIRSLKNGKYISSRKNRSQKKRRLNSTEAY